MADEDQQLFVLTKRVKEALELINALDESKLAVIVKRLVRNIGEKVAPFTTEELEQLQEHLQLAEGCRDLLAEVGLQYHIVFEHERVPPARHTFRHAFRHALRHAFRRVSSLRTGCASLQAQGTFISGGSERPAPTFDMAEVAANHTLRCKEAC